MSGLDQTHDSDNHVRRIAGRWVSEALTLHREQHPDVGPMPPSGDRCPLHANGLEDASRDGEFDSKRQCGHLFDTASPRHHPPRRSTFFVIAAR